jgi:L-rhamnose mutarotase
MKKYYLALDLINDIELIKAYDEAHKNIWIEVIEHIKDLGIEHLDIHRVENRLVMTIEVNDAFSFERKTKADESNPVVVEWERLMWKYQKILPNTNSGEKWRLMEPVFSM